MDTTTTHQEDKTKSLWTIAYGFAVIFLAILYTKYSEKGSGLHSFGVVLGLIGFPLWAYGFIKHAQAKGRSEILAVFLSFFGLLGLTILLLLPDRKGKPEGE